MSDLSQYGILGLVVAALCWYILRIEKQRKDEIKAATDEHRVEREEWRKTIDKQMDEQNKNIKDNTSVLSGLKTLLENRK